jgi:hypothetical protein
MQKEKYRLRFFFDYNCGGCLWSDNKAAYEDFGVGVLDAETTDVVRNVCYPPKIKLPDELRRKVLYLDKKYSKSLDWNNPAGPSLWNEKQWIEFRAYANELYREISALLKDYFEIIYAQE